MDLWYFAYGSNLCVDQMLERVGSIGSPLHPPRIAQLANHQLVFQELEIGGHAYANIISPGSGVIGVVYRLNEVDLATLDRYEAGYERCSLTVTDLLGQTLEASAYVVRLGTPLRLRKPRVDYLERIVKGARRHGLPEAYVSEILRIYDSALP